MNGMDLDKIIIGKSEAVFAAKKAVEQAKGLRILLVGETGVGKTPFARYSNAVVSQMEGRERPFEQINCACLNTEHIQDQLFGHKRGAFTGAISDKRGLVEIARGGDLFLDEIGDMPLDAQAHFLTFLDTMEYYPVGDDRKRRAEVRVICATNRDLRKMVEEGRFRKDLFSRISQVVVDIAPLRERKQDIALLTEHFVSQFTAGGKPIHPGVIACFESYDWREGNVRELRDAAEYLCLMSEEESRIEPHHLGDRYSSLPSAEDSEARWGVTVGDDLGMLSRYGLEHFLGQIEKNVLERYLDRNEGSLESAAKQLGISRPTLYRRLKKYAISTVLGNEAASEAIPVTV